MVVTAPAVTFSTGASTGCSRGDQLSIAERYARELFCHSVQGGNSATTKWLTRQRLWSHYPQGRPTSAVNAWPCRMTVMRTAPRAAATGVGGVSLSAGLNLGASFTNVPGGTANWTFTDATGNYNNASGTAAIVITKADATVSGQRLHRRATTATRTAPPARRRASSGETLAGLNLGASFTNVPGGTANWTFTDATGNYNNAERHAAIVISKADATVSVNGYTGVYDGAAHGATGTATGVKRRDPHRPEPGGQLHQRPRRHGQLDVHRTARATTTTPAARGDRDQQGRRDDQRQRLHRRVRRRSARRDRHGEGRPAARRSGGLNLGASFTNVPGGTANWTFTDVHGQLQQRRAARSAIVISKADATISVTAVHRLYDARRTARRAQRRVGGVVSRGLDLARRSRSARWHGELDVHRVTGNYNNKTASGQHRDQQGRPRPHSERLHRYV